MKSFHVGLGAASLMLMLATTATAQGVPEYSVSRRSDNRAALTVRSGDFRFEELLSPTKFAFTIEFAGDRVQVAGDDNGELMVVRGNRQHVLNMVAASDVHLREVRALLTGSPALKELERVANVSSNTASKYAALLQNAHALVRTVQGDLHATGRVVVQGMAQQSGGYRVVAQQLRPDECWDGYRRSVLRYTYELESCVNEWRTRFNPAITAWCGYEYNIKATLAGFWLLSCNVG
jgi:hypothetical protein